MNSMYEDDNGTVWFRIGDPRDVPQPGDDQLFPSDEDLDVDFGDPRLMGEVHTDLSHSSNEEKCAARINDAEKEAYNRSLVVREETLARRERIVADREGKVAVIRNYIVGILFEAFPNATTNNNKDEV